MAMVQLRRILILATQVVPQESASIPPYVAIGIHRNHTGMTKFEDKDDPGFVALAGELRRWIKTISEETRSLSERCT